MAFETDNQNSSNSAQFNWRLATVVGAVMAILILAAGVDSLRQKEEPKKKPKALQMTTLIVRTTPSGASIRINNEVKCTSDCTLELVEGEHQIQAFLPGYEPRVSTVNLAPGVPIDLDLTMEAQTMGMRVFSDLPSGKVVLDNEAVGYLQEGQLGVDRISAGRHKVQLVSAKGSAEFEFESTPGAAPQLVSPLIAAELFALVVGHAEGRAELYTNEQPLKVQMDESQMGEIGPLGLQLHNLQKGDRTFVVGEGQRQKTLIAPLGSQPVLLLFVRFDPNAGSLLVKSNEEDASVYLNNGEYWKKIKSGKVEIKNLPVGPMQVRVAKWQFNATPLSIKTEIKKGEQTELSFQLRAAAVTSASKPVKIEEPPPMRENPTPPPMPSVVLPKSLIVQGGDAFLSQWEDQTNWSDKGGWRLKKGGNFVFFAKRPVQGTLRFSMTLVKGKKLQWFAGFRDSNNFVLYQLDGVNFIRREYVDGKSSDLKTAHDMEGRGSFTVQIRVAPGSITHELLDGAVWKRIDVLSGPGRDFSNGRFGLLLPGDDTYGVSNFYYSGK